MKEPKPPRRPRYTNALGMRASRLRDLAYSHERNAWLLYRNTRPTHDSEAHCGWLGAHKAIARLAKKEAARLDRLAANQRARRQ